MENRQNLHLVMTKAVRDNKRSARDDELSRCCNTAFSANMRMMFQHLHNRQDVFDQVVGRRGILSSKVFVSGLQVAGGERRPAQLHRCRRLAKIFLTWT